MHKHTLIRQTVSNALKAMITDSSVHWYDGRPAILHASELPVVAVYLTDATPIGDSLDGNEWRATLHVEVFLSASSHDSELDLWMENKIYPFFSSMPALSELVESSVTQGYHYQRDDELATWGSADLRHTLTYTL